MSKKIRIVLEIDESLIIKLISQLPKEDIVKLDTDPAENLLNLKIVDHQLLSYRAVNCLLPADITTFRELKEWNKKDLLKLRNTGIKTVLEIQKVFQDHGIQWG